jgi:hypothetical protein
MDDPVCSIIILVGFRLNAAAAPPGWQNRRTDGMHQRQFIFAVQRFRDLRRQRSQGAVAIGGEVGTVGGIDADHGDHLQKGKMKAPHDATLG